MISFEQGDTSHFPVPGHLGVIFVKRQDLLLIRLLGIGHVLSAERPGICQKFLQHPDTCTRIWMTLGLPGGMVSTEIDDHAKRW